MLTPDKYHIHQSHPMDRSTKGEPSLGHYILRAVIIAVIVLIAYDQYKTYQQNRALAEVAKELKVIGHVQNQAAVQAYIDAHQPPK